jgi:hypothetical protein
MGLVDTMRERLREAWDLDTLARGGEKRTIKAWAAKAGVDADHLSKFLRGDSGMDLDKIAAVAKVMGRDLSWLLGTGHLSGSLVPVVLSSRYPVNATPDKLPAALAAAAIVPGVSSAVEAVNLTGDPLAHWIHLQETFGEYAAEDWTLISPGTEVSNGDAIGAVLAVELRFVVGIFQTFRGVPCLSLASGRLYEPTEFRAVGPVMYHLKKKRR